MKKAVRFLFVLIFALCATALAAEDVLLESEVLKLVLHDQTGSFSLYRRNGKKDRLQPYTEVSATSASTFFAVKAGNSYLPLRRSYEMSVNTVKNEDGSASFVWTIGTTVEAEIRFTLVSSEEEQPADVVRVDLTIMNLSEREGEFAMKAVIDTTLGETSRIHFTTASGTAIRTEKAWSSMTQDKWLSSSDGSGTVSFVLAGSAATAPEYVLAASRDLLVSDGWKPVVNEGRTFSTFQSPNNSAIGIWYKPVKLKMYEKSCSTFFMTTAANGDIPPNSMLIGIDTEEGREGLSESTVASATQIVDAAVGAEPGATQTVQKKIVDYAYVQQLLDRIKEIEDSDNPDSEEIAKLSAEIDALILELTE